jgi:hypothetical protein
MMFAVRIVVMMNRGETLLAIVSWSRGSFQIKDRKSLNGRWAGFVQRVMAKSARRLAWTASKDNANGFDKKVSSSTNLQLTVHWYMNCLVNSKALAKY